MKAIGAGAFSGCGSLMSLPMSGSVETVGASAFYKCGKDAFAGCGSLARICMPSSLSEINASVFSLPFADSDGEPLSADAKTLRGYFYQKSGGKFVRA